MQEKNFQPIRSVLLAIACSFCPYTGVLADDNPNPDEGRAGMEREFTDLKIKFCWCPPGTFKMGEPTRNIDVELSQGFWLGKYEVTQKEFEQVMRKSPWRTIGHARLGENYAASGITWKQAVEYCEKLTKNEHREGRLNRGWAYRLPTEAEWEYACRAGTTTAYSFGDSATALGDYAWTGHNALSMRELYAHEVGMKKPNLWGLQDMHGNVWEWCQDVYEKDLRGGRDPKGPAPGRSPFRVLRGGCWSIKAPKVFRSAYREWAYLTLGYDERGFRLVLSPSAQ